MKDKLSYKNIKLRALELEDVNLLYTWENDTTLWHLSNTKTPFSRYDLEQFILNSSNDIYQNKQLRLIIENESGISVGAIDLFDFDPFHQRAGIGILIYDTTNREQGYAENAIILIGNYCKEVLELHQLYANIAESNDASIQLFKKTGFEQCALKSDWLKTDNGWENELMFQKLL